MLIIAKLFQLLIDNFVNILSNETTKNKIFINYHNILQDSKAFYTLYFTNNLVQHIVF